MGPLDDIILKGILAIGSAGKLLQKEDDKIEYKELFENGSKEAKAKYAKEMAALYNYEGGYLIFGVNDASELVGLKSFVEPDNAELVNDINNYFSPAIRFQSKKIHISGKDVFVIYIEKRNSIPTVCIKGHQDTLREATIYCRYSAQSAPITAGDLINLLNSLKGEDSKELVEIAKKDFRSKFKPRLELNGVSKNGNELKFSIENRGEIAHVDNFEILESNCKQIFPPTWKNYPISKDRGAQALVKLDMHWQQANFKLALNYHDDEGHKYQSIIDFPKTIQVLETKEL
jgi:hypothetical protein